MKPDNRAASELVSAGIYVSAHCVIKWRAYWREIVPFLKFSGKC
jgi:hypothetical protein